MLTIWEQLEWHGIVRRGPMLRDFFSSRVEVNTEPGQDEIKRLTAREPYLSAQLAAPAAYFTDPYVHYKLYQLTGPTGTAPDFGMSGTAFRFAACIQPPDEREEQAATYAPIAAASEGGNSDDNVAWKIDLIKNTAENWVVRAKVRDSISSLDIVTSTITLESSSWYWVQLRKNLNLGYIYMYLSKDGSDTVHSVSNTYTSATYSGNFALTIGGFDDHTYPCTRAKIAYAALGDDTGWPVPWRATLAQNASTTPELSFMPTHPERTIIPALINDGQKYCWIQFPRFGARMAETTSTFSAKGVSSSCGKSYEVQLGDKTLLQDLTVFMFLVRWDGHCDLFRSYDGQFRIGSELLNASGDQRLSVLWPPNDQTQGDEDWGRLKEETTSAGSLSSSAEHWLAVECDPTIQGSARNLTVYEWDTSAWSMIGGTASYGGGILPIDFSKCSLMETWGPEAHLYDFRVVVGDEGWATTYTPTSMLNTVPKSLVSWLNHDTSVRWGRPYNVATRTMPDDADLYDRDIALTDRVDGLFRYTVDGRKPRLAWDGCSHLKNAVLPEPHDMLCDPAGTVSGVTDFYYFDDNTTLPSIQSDVKGTRRYARVGSHKYVVGPGPLQLCAQDPKVVGLSRPFVRANAVTDEATATQDFKGHLSWATEYKVVATLVDPVTGSESNHFGPWRFVTGSAPGGTTAPPVDSPGCGFDIAFSLYSAQSLMGYDLKIYRQYAPSGVYHYEGRTSIAEWTYDTTRYHTLFYAQFRIGIKDATLANQPEIWVDNDDPPLHSHTYIWGARAWFVDAVNPTRIWYSKLNDFGSVPGSYLLWTDEGIGGNILGFLPGFGGMLVLRERGIWIIPQFVNAAQAFVQPLLPDVGCVSGAGACFAEGILWWASAGGIYSYDGHTITNHSDRLDGVDRKVWDHAPRKTVAYYDRMNWRVLFICDGAGIAIDVRSGATTLVAAPENCIVEAATTAYSGPLYGCEGMVYKEGTGNKGLTLDSSGAISGESAGPVTAAGINGLNFNWHDLVSAHVGTALVGYEIPDLNASAQNFLDSTSAVGRLLISKKSDNTELWGKVIHSVGETNSVTSYAMVRTEQALSDEFYVDRLPMYYESQDLYLGPRAESRVHKKLDLVTGELTSTATADVALYSKIPGYASEMVATARGTLTEEKDFNLQASLRGNQCRYVVSSHAPGDLAEIKSVRVHFEPGKPRGRNR
jgi:hypothetical protein